MAENKTIHAAVNIAHIGTFLLTAFLVAITVWPLPWMQKGDRMPIMAGILVGGLAVAGLLQWKAASVARSAVATPTPDSSANQHLPMIEILTPLNNGEVSFKRTVSGLVRTAHSPVQVWVLAGNGIWYRQPVTVDGCAWSAACQFGDKPLMEKPSGNYQIIAIADANIREELLTTLPDIGIKSEIIKVRRAHN